MNQRKDMFLFKILVISKYFTPSCGGGERQLSYFLQALAPQSSIQVLTVQPDATLPFKTIGENINIKSFWTDNIEKSFLRIRDYLIQYNTNAQIAYIVLYQKEGVGAQFEIVRYLKSLGLKIVVRFSSLGEATEFIKKTNRHDFFSYVDQVVCLSPTIETELKRIGCADKKIYKFKNPVDTNLFSPSKHVNNKSNKKFIVLSRPHRKKNWLLIVDAWSKSKNNKDNLNFVFNENNSEYLVNYRKEIEAYASCSDRAQSIIFLPNCEMNDAVKHLKESDVIISASINEGMQNTLLEALSCGLTVIAPNSLDFDYLPKDKSIIRYTLSSSDLSRAIEKASSIHNNKDSKRGDLLNELRKIHNINNYLYLIQHVSQLK